MARIRSIKPEFPQSESMGRLSRDARLLFILLWPICDDHGRTRAASRMLASTLFPYDDDAGKLMDGWLDDLERENCIRRYVVNGASYLEICNWLIHQRIDKPSKAQFPAFSECSENTREGSRGVEEPSPLEGKGREGKGKEDTPAEKPAGTSAIELQTWIESCKAMGEKPIPESDPIFAYAETVGLPTDFLSLAWGWFKDSMVGKRKKDWRAHFRNAVKGNWPRYWRQDGDGWALTVAGEQARRAQA